jgi:hypothetical protein
MIETVANTVAIFCMTLVIWISLWGAGRLTPADASIWAFPISAFVAAVGLYHWQGDNGSRKFGLTAFFWKFLVGAIGIGVLVFLDALIAQVNIFDRSNWPRMWKTNASMSITLTVGLGVSMLLVGFGGLIRSIIFFVFAGKTPSDEKSMDEKI